MRLSILKSTGSVVFFSFVILGCADIQVAKNAYRNGDYELAEKNYKELSKRGFPVAYKGLGDINFQKQNEQLSLKYYTKAYNSGYTDAAADIAKVKLQHATTQQEYRDVYKWLLKAKKSKNSEYIKFELAVMKLEGKGVRQNVQEALNELNELAQKGYPRAHIYLANLYENGEYLPLSYEKALKHYTHAYNLGYKDAKIKIADIYANKNSGFYDKNKAELIYKEYSMLGNGYASYQIAKLYKNNIKEALKWYIKSANEGYLQGILKVELFRLDGFYMEQDKKTALHNLKKLSEDGFSNASIALGNIYHSGIYVKKDDKKALEYFEKAYKQSNPRAKLFMAEIYAQKNSPFKNEEKAKEILQNYNSIEAKHILADLYKDRGMLKKAKELYTFCAKYNYMPSVFALAQLNGDIKTIRKLSEKGYVKATLYLADIAKKSNRFEDAVALYKKAFENGDKNSMLKVADIYAYTTFQNLSKAKDIYNSYAKKGNVLGIYKLAKFMQSQNYSSKEVYELYKKASDMGYVPAKIKLGDLYLNAEGVEGNLELALKYYKEAYNLGDENAELKIAYLLYYGYATDNKKQEAKKIYEKHARSGDFKAAYTLASIYEAEENPNKALYWYDYASKYGCVDAKYKLAMLIQKNNPKKAKRLLKEAAIGNHPKAQIEYGKNLFYTQRGEKHQFEGLKMLYMALFNGESEAIDIIMKMVDDIDNLDEIIPAYKAAKKEKKSL